MVPRSCSVLIFLECWDLGHSPSISSPRPPPPSPSFSPGHRPLLLPGLLLLSMFCSLLIFACLINITIPDLRPCPLFSLCSLSCGVSLTDGAYVAFCPYQQAENCTCLPCKDPQHNMPPRDPRGPSCHHPFSPPSQTPGQHSPCRIPAPHVHPLTTSCLSDL